MNKTILALKVRNHPGVMSHVCGLFTRRAYNMEGILCIPEPNDTYSRIWILVNEDERLPQIIKQTKKLQDVIEIEHHVDFAHLTFSNLQDVFNPNKRLTAG